MKEYTQADNDSDQLDYNAIARAALEAARRAR